MDILIDTGDAPFATLIFAHGAGAPMDAAVMNRCTELLCQAGFRIARFEFAYMAARRNGQRKPPPKAETLVEEYRAAVAALDATGPLIIGGKSMGGRVASMASDGLHADGKVAGLFCLGYPFHPPAKPEQLRTAHLLDLKTPALICQGTRDPFGTQEEVAGYKLPASIEIQWFEDGDHDLKPRKWVSGFTQAEHLAA
ncbi:MAG: alpha/beta hydrolase family protein, partial [Aliihoeflea sp.]|uniref:alpha/beta hydrolase family protein n=3 Tax=Aliihoeflea sp. TaxID=2608088 RepID=UPI00403808A3